MARAPKFIDHAKIFVQAGNGGNGHIGFRREKFIPKGGPNGGDGGSGGDVVLIGAKGMATLLDFQYRRHFRAQHGEPGGRAQRTGAEGDPCEIHVPLGTIVLTEDEKPFGEVLTEEQRLIVAKGGHGGLGNIHFKSSINQAPRKSTPGKEGEQRWIRLELQLLADVAIVGPPNAGKSTLLSTITKAHPKVADYPFTTLSPVLGVLVMEGRAITLADIPGLIEGAHAGTGLGIEFLRHIRRTRAMLYMISIESGDPEITWSAFCQTRDEIAKYDPELLGRATLVALNKTDLLSDNDVQITRNRFRKEGVETLPISAKKNVGLDDLKDWLHESV